LEITTKSIGFIFTKGRKEEAKQEENEARKFINAHLCVCILPVAKFLIWAEYFLVWPERDYIQKGHSSEATRPTQ
jgi:hypothetical protein